MRSLSWIPRWVVVLLLLTNALVDSHMLHYLHLKKFLTAVAFAKALGKRPTVLPIPIPVPIPIAQNEVIRIPVGGGSKTMILDGNKGGSKGVGISQILGSGSHGIDFSGSSPYGYAVPGISSPGVINLPSMKASDSNVINLASALGSTNGSPRIIVLGGQGSGHALNSMVSGGGPSVLRLNDVGSSNIQMAASGLSSLVTGGGPSIIRLNDIGSSNIQMGTGGMNLGFNPLSWGGNGLMTGMNNFGDLDSALSVKHPFVYQRPYNVYSDKPRRKFPLRFRGRRTHNNLTESKFHNHKHGDRTYDNQYISSEEEERQPHNANQSFTQEKHKKPIPVGEKFTYRP